MGGLGVGCSDGSIMVKVEIVTITVGFPVTEKIWFVPDFIIKIGELFAVLEGTRVVFDSFLDDE